ncbi:Outer membrane protein assembly factor BamB [Streptomyces sp. YIM 130001]|uniref:outer membrane protein assembly factor BamB family protein n=1 Tax=Streptomyces sp. YIM 130001 TaxID=2259644 RepID=UPI000E658690|nr:PQQ-binding-like beta-propeller repeat protein [Streptomyces sp. YIM 130001]RII15011.1 Outer membrane protein assembly factor BamB [Streptomyces sp. YIM 130001]
MTQPPQPPNEPPQGGFGAPQDPPPGGPGTPQEPQSGGFGAPQDPPPGGFGAPQDPGYGYPQTPPPAGPPQTPPPSGPPSMPPPGAPGAGQPPATPAPGYGYPQGPGQPTPAPGQYGYPGQQQPQYGSYQQQPPPPSGGPGGGKKLNTQMTIIIAAVVAVALIVGGGVLFANSKGDDDKKDEAKSSAGTEGKGGNTKGGGGTGGGKEKAPANTKSKVAYQIPMPEVKEKNDSVVVDGSWTTDKVYAKSGISQIVGYDVKTGKKSWDVPLKGPICWASDEVNEDGITAVVFQGGKPTKEETHKGCTEVGALDLNSGKLLWTKQAKTGDEKVRMDEVTISGDTVAAGGTSGGAAWDVKSGKSLWQPEVSADECKDVGYQGGEALAVVRKCGPYDSATNTIQTIDPKNGKVLASYKMSSGIEYPHIVSSKPLVVAADVGDTAGDGSGISDFFSIDDKTGKLITKITADAEKYGAECKSTEVSGCSQVVIGNGKIYLPTEEHDAGTGEYGQTNEIVSFDLKTGKQTSDRADAGDKYSISPLRMDGTNLLAYKTGPYDKGGQVVSINGDSFQSTVLMENPADRSLNRVEKSFQPSYSEIRYVDGRLFMAGTYARKPTGSDVTPLAIVFSTQ